LLRCLREGFRDSTGTYLTYRDRTGVWVSNQPLDINEGAEGHVESSIPNDALEKYESGRPGKPYRECLIPTVVLDVYDARESMAKTTERTVAE
jgi:hypothetical protein